MATRWGIVSAGKISHDFVTAVSSLSRDEHVVAAVAARNLDSARAFALKHKIATAYGSYEELAKDENIDVIYIGSIHPQHYTLSKLMLENGKPILCEKPLTVNLKQTSELIALARKKNLFLMEAIWSRCFPVYDVVKREIENGAIGDVQQVIANFGVPIEDVDRIKYKELGGGSILDLGVYCIQFAVFVLGISVPEVIATGNLNEHGADSNMAAIFKYRGGKTAILSTHTKARLPNEAFVVGSKGTIKIPSPFWCPTKVITPSKEEFFAVPVTDGKYNFDNSSGLSYEAIEVRRCLQKGLIESPKVTHAESLVIAELEDMIRKQVGVVYSEDS